MATEGLAANPAPARPSLDTRIAEAGFVVLLLVIIVGLQPFDDRSYTALKARNAATVAGDLTRQLVFLGTFAVIAYAAFKKRGAQAITAMPLAMAAMLAWCLASALWGNEPDIIARRAILTAIFVASMMLSVDTLGTERTVA